MKFGLTEFSTNNCSDFSGGLQESETLELHRQNINSPGISAAVSIDGKLVWAGGSGWADIEADKPVSKQTQFRIGSTSKALTSTLLARLVQDKALSLDTSLGTMDVGSLNPNWNNITVRQLASHTAGMQESANAPYQQLMQTQVFAPLGMAHTYSEPPIGQTTADMARFSRGSQSWLMVIPQYIVVGAF